MTAATHERHTGRARLDDWGVMQARYEELSLDTQGHGEVIDLTAQAQKAIDNAGISDGLCTVFVAHSTCGMTTIECEPGCNADLNAVLERIAPEEQPLGAQRAQCGHQRAQPRPSRAHRPVGDGARWPAVSCSSASGRRSCASTSTTGPGPAASWSSSSASSGNGWVTPRRSRRRRHRIAARSRRRWRCTTGTRPARPARRGPRCSRS